jgi:hypothetical protein
MFHVLRIEQLLPVGEGWMIQPAGSLRVVNVDLSVVAWWTHEVSLQLMSFGGILKHTS